MFTTIFCIALFLSPLQDKPKPKPKDAAEICKAAMQAYKKNASALIKSDARFERELTLSRLLENRVIQINGKPIDTKDFAPGFAEAIKDREFTETCETKHVGYSGENSRVRLEIRPIQRPWKSYMTGDEKSDYGRMTGVKRGNKMKQPVRTAGDSSRDGRIERDCQARKDRIETISLEVEVPKGQEFTDLGTIVFTVEEVHFTITDKEPLIYVNSLDVGLVEWKPKKKG